MLQPNPHHRPIRAQLQPVRPFHDHDRVLAKNILKSQRLQIMKIPPAIKVHVINPLPSLVLVHQRKRRARDVVFPRRPRPRRNPFRQRRLPGSQIPRKQHQNRRPQPRANFPAPRDRFFRRMRLNLPPTHGRTRHKIADTPAESRESNPKPATVPHPSPHTQCLRPARANKLRTPARAPTESHQTGPSTPPAFRSTRPPFRPYPSPDFPWNSQTPAHRAPPPRSAAPSKSPSRPSPLPTFAPLPPAAPARPEFRNPANAPSLPDVASTPARRCHSSALALAPQTHSIRQQPESPEPSASPPRCAQIVVFHRACSTPAQSRASASLSTISRSARIRSCVSKCCPHP